VHSPRGADGVMAFGRGRSVVEGKKKREREPRVEDDVLAVHLDFDGQD
jgi:hypothetical protein